MKGRVGGEQGRADINQVLKVNKNKIGAGSSGEENWFGGWGRGFGGCEPRIEGGIVT